MTIRAVKWFNNQKGYGSIQPEDGTKRGRGGKTSAVSLKQT